MASIRQRASGWRAEVCVNGTRDSATFDTKAEARAWAAQREVDLRQDSRLGHKTTKTLRQVLERYRDEVSVHRKGAKWETNRINAIIRDYEKLVNKRLSSISTDDFVHWRNDRLAKVSPASVRREANLLSSALSVARTEWKWLGVNPMSDLKKPAKAAHRDRRISEDEQERLLLSMGHSDATPSTYTQQVAVAFLFALETAMRAGEIYGLQWQHVNLQGRYVTLPDTKNGTKRHVPLSRRAVALLEQMRGIHSQRVFTVSGDSASVLFAKARRRTQIADLRFHDTRHEALTRLAKKLHVLDLARMVGHKDPRSLMIYYNATATEIAQQLD